MARPFSATIQILLDGCDTGRDPIYAPGDVVCGVALYHSKSRLAYLRSIRIGFTGLGFVQQQSGDNPDSTMPIMANLFQQFKTLFCNSSSPQNIDTLVMPFEFKFPSYHDYWNQKWPLPPSFAQLFNGTKGHPPFWVSVRYALRLYVDEGRFHEPRIVTKVLVMRQISSDTPSCRDSPIAVALKDYESVARWEEASKHTKACVGTNWIVRSLMRKPPSQPFDISVLVPKSLWLGQQDYVFLVVNNPSSKNDRQYWVRNFRLRLSSEMLTIGQHRHTRDYQSHVGHCCLALSLKGERVALMSDFGMGTFTSNYGFLPTFTSAEPYFRIAHSLDIRLEVAEYESDNVWQVSGRCEIKVLPPLREARNLGEFVIRP